MSWLCRLELSSSPLLIAYAGRPAPARAWLMTARTLSAAEETGGAGDAMGGGEGRAALVGEGGAGEVGADEVLVTRGVARGDEAAV
jgi:hypothetical protein